jgi:hypothetical protein
MNPRTDVMEVLANARPSRLDRTGDAPDPGLFLNDPRPQRPVGRFTALVRWSPGRRTRFPVFLPIAVAAAMIGVVLASVLIVPGRFGNQTAGQPDSAPAALELAARHVLAAKQGSGKYRRLTREHSLQLEVGPATRPYRMSWIVTDDEWQTTAAPHVAVASLDGRTPTPVTEADRQAWIADGSPTTFPSPPGTMVYMEILSSVGMVQIRGSVTPDIQAAWMQSFHGNEGELPTDPVKLKAWLAADRNGQSADHDMDDFDLFGVAEAILTETPVRPAVRAATYRMLADLPGVSLVGPVTDQHGRPGIGISFIEHLFAPGAWREDRIIIDERTGGVLALEQWSLGTGDSPAAIGDLVHYSLTVTDERTNVGPTGFEPMPPGSTPNPFPGLVGSAEPTGSTGTGSTGSTAGQTAPAPGSGGGTGNSPTPTTS